MKFLRTIFCSIALAVGFAGVSMPAIAASMPSCAAGDPVVWENTSTKVYHESGDKYYGNTKSGVYACKSDADKGGFHLSKSKSKGGSTTAASTAAPDADAGGSPAPGASPTGKHHRHKKGALTGGATPAPDAMSSAAPGATPSPTGKHHHHKKGSTASPAPAAT